MKLKKLIAKGILFSMLTTSAHSYTHVHPAPVLPKIVDLQKTVDPTATNIIWNIHAMLFRLENNIPKPMLLKTFSTSRDGKRYKMTLKKDLEFHDGSSLEFSDVRHSFESLIKAKAMSYEKLSTIVGYNDFVAGRSDHLKGLKGRKGSLDFEIELSKPDPLLPMKLSEAFFAIVPSSNSNQVGLGLYKIKSISKNKIILKLSDKKNGNNIPDTIEYISATKSEAFDMFKKGKVHDLFSYPVNAKEVADLNGAKKKPVLTPKVYYFALNSRAVSKQNRKALFSKIDRQKIINSCFPDNVVAESIVPKGLLGHDPELKVNFSNKNIYLDEEITINIGNGSGNEECVKAQLEKMLSPHCKKLSISIDNTSKNINRWNQGKLTGIFSYFQPFNSLDFFQGFNPQAYFSFSDHTDQKLIDLIKANMSTDVPIDRIEYSKKINRRVLEHATFLPIFSGEAYIVYSSRYKKLSRIIPAVEIRFDDFEI